MKNNLTSLFFFVIGFSFAYLFFFCLQIAIIGMIYSAITLKTLNFFISIIVVFIEFLGFYIIFFFYRFFKIYCDKIYELGNITSPLFKYIIYIITLMLSYVLVQDTIREMKISASNDTVYLFLVPIFAFVIFFIMDTMTNLSKPGINDYKLSHGNNNAKNILKKIIYSVFTIIAIASIISIIGYKNYQKDMDYSIDSLFVPFFKNLKNREFNLAYDKFSENAKQIQEKQTTYKLWEKYLDNKIILSGNMTIEANPFIYQEIIEYSAGNIFSNNGMKVNLNGIAQYDKNEKIPFYAELIKENNNLKFERIDLLNDSDDILLSIPALPNFIYNK